MCIFYCPGCLVSPRPALVGPDVAYIGSRVTFWCSAPHSSPPITYELLRDGDVPVISKTVREVNQSAAFVLKVTATVEGSYRCRVAAGRSGVSNSIQLSVVSEYSAHDLSRALDVRSQSLKFPTFQRRRGTPECPPNPSRLSCTRGGAWCCAARPPEDLTCPTPGSSTREK